MSRCKILIIILHKFIFINYFFCLYYNESRVQTTYISGSILHCGAPVRDNSGRWQRDKRLVTALQECSLINSYQFTEAETGKSCKGKMTISRNKSVDLMFKLYYVYFLASGFSTEPPNTEDPTHWGLGTQGNNPAGLATTANHHEDPTHWGLDITYFTFQSYRTTHGLFSSWSHHSGGQPETYPELSRTSRATTRYTCLPTGTPLVHSRTLYERDHPYSGKR